MVLISELGTGGGWSAVLGIGPREHVAIVGGGGKTSLCFALAKELWEAGKRVITTTTTKVWHREADRAPCLIFSPFRSSDFSLVIEGLRQKRHVFVAKRPLDTGKVEGILPETADAFFQDLDIDYVIVEADGAAGRPVKLPAAHEPVIPLSATLVVAVIGLEAMGMPLDPERVFRLELFRDVTGLGEGDTLTPGALATILQSPKGLFRGAPVTARKLVFLNKSDQLRSGQDADELARRLLRFPGAPIERVIIGSLLQGTCRVWMRNDQGIGVNP